MPKVSVKYPTIHTLLRAKCSEKGPLTSDECKDLIGWATEPPDEDWKNVFTLKDSFGKKVRLLNSPKNRPFRLALAGKYANEHLRGKWELNLETIVFDQNGHVPQGQHRLAGFILAEQLRAIDTKQWGKTPLVFEVLLGFGVSPSPNVANSFDKGDKRSLSDVLYRHEKFKKSLSDREQRTITKVLATATRLVWLRTGGKQIRHAPHFPHSEALEFYGKHPKLLQAVTSVIDLDNGEEGGERRISSFISLGFASSVYYLTAAHKGWEKTKEFWSAFASAEGLQKGSPILALRQRLLKLDTSGNQRDEAIGTVIKAWLLWLGGEKTTLKELKLKRTRSTSADGEEVKLILAEFPRVGGLDEVVEMPQFLLTQQQLTILYVLGRLAPKQEMTYKALTQATGIPSATLSRLLMKETTKGEENPHSLSGRGLVKVSQYPPEDGQKVAPYQFQLTPKGRK